MKRAKKDLLNMLVAAGFVVLVLFAAVGVHAWRVARSEEARLAETLRDGAIESHALAFSDVPALPLPSPSAPLSEAALARVQASLVLLSPSLDSAEPYFYAVVGLYVSPRVLDPLSRLAQAFRAERYAESLLVTAAFRPDPTSPVGTGCALTLAVRTADGAALPLSASAEAAARLRDIAPQYGFIPLSEDGAEFYYIGYPHARLMAERRLTPAQYVSYLALFSREQPLTVRVSDKTYRLYYLPAADGVATLTLPRNTPFSATQVGAAGFLIVLSGDGG